MFIAIIEQQSTSHHDNHSSGVRRLLTTTTTTVVNRITEETEEQLHTNRLKRWWRHSQRTWRTQRVIRCHRATWTHAPRTRSKPTCTTPLTCTRLSSAAWKVRIPLSTSFLSSHHRLFIYTDDSYFYLSPDRLRRPLIFYFVHTASLYVNKLMLAGLINVSTSFSSLFSSLLLILIRAIASLF